MYFIPKENIGFTPPAAAAGHIYKLYIMFSLPVVCLHVFNQLCQLEVVSATGTQ